MIRVTTIFAALSMALFATACSKDDANKDEAAPTAAAPAPDEAAAPAADETAKTAKADEVAIGTVTAEELEKQIESGDCAVLDANGDKVRQEYGKIPTATLLSHYKDYELSELPADKAAKLVFYCSNTQCGASKKGAKRALAAGYTDVNVLPVGVMGWKEAGKKTEKAL
jgi:rhodanese-related sulfurtransferase